MVDGALQAVRAGRLLAGRGFCGREAIWEHVVCSEDAERWEMELSHG